MMIIITTIKIIILACHWPIGFPDRLSSCRQLLKPLPGVWAGLFGVPGPSLLDPRLEAPDTAHPLGFWGLLRAKDSVSHAADVSLLSDKSSTCKSKSCMSQQLSEMLWLSMSAFVSLQASFLSHKHLMGVMGVSMLSTMQIQVSGSQL